MMLRQTSPNQGKNDFLAHKEVIFSALFICPQQEYRKFSKGPYGALCKEGGEIWKKVTAQAAFRYWKG
jgi:hypothetical protein